MPFTYFEGFCLADRAISRFWSIASNRVICGQDNVESHQIRSRFEPARAVVNPPFNLLRVNMPAEVII